MSCVSGHFRSTPYSSLHFLTLDSLQGWKNSWEACDEEKCIRFDPAQYRQDGDPYYFDTYLLASIPCRRFFTLSNSPLAARFLTVGKKSFYNETLPVSDDMQTLSIDRFQPPSSSIASISSALLNRNSSVMLFILFTYSNTYSIKINNCLLLINSCLSITQFHLEISNALLDVKTLGSGHHPFRDLQLLMTEVYKTPKVQL